MTAHLLITAPMKIGDPTEYTYQWARKAIWMAKDRGYRVKTLEKDKCTRSAVNKEIKDNKPRLFLHIGHGCKRSLQSNIECILNSRHEIDEIMSLAYSDCECNRKKALELLSETYSYSLYNSNNSDNNSQDPCELSCLFDSNIQELDRSLVTAIACNSSDGLGRDAINSGIQAYAGNRDLLVFPVDSLRTQEVFGDMELKFVHELLLGRNFRDAKKAKLKMMDTFITKNKRTKYMSLLALFNRLNFEILGDLNATIFT